MKYVFAFLAVLFYLVAFGGCMMAKSSIHEIQAGISVIVGTLFFVAAGIIDAVQALVRELRRHPPQ